uniref:RNA-dependent RNA polymerase n=1 Tax=Heterobasidion partitivirus 9 TaxID=1387300 RepID=H2DHK0_9VIRU|nr:RNA-dependent RNA polymerase [Heterobasidion partitivirus 9]
MEYLSNLFSRVLKITKTTNFEFVGTYHNQPSIPQVNQIAIDNHQRTIRVAMERYLTSDEFSLITTGYKRTSLDPATITDDFFSGDIEPHDEPQDLASQLAIEAGLNAMQRAFCPPNPARPVHLYDVEWHYPYKWQVNAEVPFSTETYFLKLRKKFSDFYDAASKTWTHYVNPLDALRRYGPEPPFDTLNQVTPPKFGFMKELIFSFVHSWLHVIKSRFHSNAGYTHSNFLRQRFLFPMQLHIKTALVKADQPNKLRSIWGVSKLWIIAETMIYWELIAYMKLNRGSTPMLWGYETFTGGWFRLNAELQSSHLRQSIITIDWSRFDKRAYFWLIRKILFRIRQHLDFNNGYVGTKDYPSSPTDPDKLQALWEWTLEALFDSPIILPDGKMYKRRFAGIPSGLYITQLLDSWYNYTMLAAILTYLGLDPERCIIKVQGDDSIIRLYVLIPPSEHDNFLLKMQEVATHLFASRISDQKSEVRDDLNGAEVLSYRNNRGLPYRDEIQMVAQFYHTKAKDPTPEITMAQAIGFAYAACGNNYRIHSLLEEVYNYYHEQGFTPNPAGLSIVFGDSPDRPDYPIELDHFPTQQETQRFLLSTDYRNAEQDARTWPLLHFLHAPCSRS